MRRRRRSASSLSQPTCECDEHPARLIHQIQRARRAMRFAEARFHGKQNMTLRLSNGTVRDSEKVDVFAAVKPTVAFGDVRMHRR